MKIASLYNPKTITKRCADVSITAKQKKAAKEWLSLLKENKLEKEVSNYPNFMDIILRDLLGFPEKEIRKGYERKNVEFSFKYKDGSTAVCFEAKSTETKDLFARQRYGRKDQETPVIQTYTNMGRFPAAYGVCTNYKDFILLDTKHGLTKCHQFNFTGIENNENRLKEFLSIFSYENLVLKKTLESLYLSSVTEEREFTKEFYKLFHETRLMLIEAFREKEDVSMEEAIHYSQLFLNRLIFIFFAEDQNFLEERLFTKRVLGKLDREQCNEFSKEVSDAILNLFKILDKGSKIEGIFGFNGGLFEKSIPPKIFFYDLKDPEFFKKVKQHSKLSKSIKLDEFSSKIIKKYKGKLNPIISNLLIMDSFDFTSEVNVYILGHIFEQSISDLEELIEEKITRRKKEGVYYTPEFVTDYICRNTIIPYLSKNGSATVQELISEYSENLTELEKKIHHIKILDPACGSGAFLLKAVEILLEIDKDIQETKSTSETQLTLGRWSEEKEITKIIEGNIFGVDVNEESTDITKLSLFLKMVTVNRKLLTLEKNIRIGNSLINDKKIDDKAFDWKTEFKNVLDSEKFDIVLGNPPYVRVQKLSYDHIDYFKEKYSTAVKRTDLYLMFFERGLDLLKEGGVLGFISSTQFVNSNYGKGLRQLLLKNRIVEFIDFGGLPVFEDATTYTGIFVIKKEKPAKFRYKKINSLDSIESYLYKQKAINIDPKTLTEKEWVLSTNVESEILNKIRNHEELQNYCIINTGSFTGKDDNFFVNDEQIKQLKLETELIKPIILGKEPKKYFLQEPMKKTIYPYKLVEGKTEIIPEDELKKKYPNIYFYLHKNKHELENRKDTRKTFVESGKVWYSYTRKGLLDLFNSEKIVLGYIVDTNTYCLDKKKQMYMVGRAFGIFPKKDLEIYYLLSILNSQVSEFLMRKTCPIKQHGFYKISSGYLHQFPIPIIPKEKQEPLIKCAKEMLRLNEEYGTKQTRFLNRVKASFKTEKITQKIKSFFKLDFIEFMNEIQKVSSITLSLKEQDEWEDYFDEYKQKLLDINEKIVKTENEIDEMVYALYDISEEEQKIIENNTEKLGKWF